MELIITKEKENKLFNRKEIRGSAESDATPSRQDIAKLLAEKFSVPPENIKIKKITGKFGSRIFDIEANIYSSKQEKDSIELKKKKDTKNEKPESAEKTAEETRQQPEQKEAKPEPEQKPEEKPDKEEQKEKNVEEKKEEESKPEPQ
jgi:ribosomal protein S24E